MEYIYDKERFQKALYNVFSKFAKSLSIDFSSGKKFAYEELTSAGFLPEEFSTLQKIEASKIFNDCVEGKQSFEEFVKFMELSAKGIKTRGEDSFAKILSEEVLKKPGKFQGEVSFEDICEFFEDKSLSVYRPLIKKIDKQAKLTSKGKIKQEDYISPKAFLRLVSSACDVNNEFAQTWDNDSVFKTARKEGMFNYNYVTDSYINEETALKLNELGYSSEIFEKINDDIEKCAQRHDFRLGKKNANDRIPFRERNSYGKKDFQIDFIPSTAKTYDELVKVFQSNLLAPYAMNNMSLEDIEKDDITIENLQSNNKLDEKLTGLNKENIERAKEYGDVIRDKVRAFVVSANIDVETDKLTKAISDEFASRGGYAMDKVEAYTTMAECAMSENVLNALPYNDAIFRAYAPNTDRNDIPQRNEADMDLPMERRRFVGSGFVRKDGILYPVDNLPISKRENAEQGENIQYKLDISSDVKEFDGMKDKWEKKYNTSFENVEKDDIIFGKNPLTCMFASEAIKEFSEKNRPDINADEIREAMNVQFETQFEYGKSKQEENVGETTSQQEKSESNQDAEEQSSVDMENEANEKGFSCNDALTIKQSYAILIEALSQVAKELENGGIENKESLFNKIYESFVKEGKSSEEQTSTDNNEEENVNVDDNKDNSQEDSSEKAQDNESESQKESDAAQQNPTEDESSSKENADVEDINSTKEKIEEITKETKRVINKNAFRFVADNEKGLYAVPNYIMLFDEQLGRIIPVAHGQSLDDAREEFIKKQALKKNISSNNVENQPVESQPTTINNITNNETSNNITNNETSNTIIQSQTTNIIGNVDVQSDKNIEKKEKSKSKSASKPETINPLEINDVSKLITASVKLGYITKEEAKEFRKQLKESKLSVLVLVKTVISEKIKSKKEEINQVEENNGAISKNEKVEVKTEESKSATNEISQPVKDESKKSSAKAKEIAGKIIANGGKSNGKKDKTPKPATKPETSKEEKPVIKPEVSKEQKPATDKQEKSEIKPKENAEEKKRTTTGKPEKRSAEKPLEEEKQSIKPTSEKGKEKDKEAERLAKLEEKRKANEARKEAERKAEEERIAREKAEREEAERLAREKAEEERKEKERRAEEERIAKEKAEEEKRLAYEKAVAEDKARMEKIVASREQIEKMLACRKFDEFLPLAKESSFFDEGELEGLYDEDKTFNEKQHYMKILKDKLREMVADAEDYLSRIPNPRDYMGKHCIGGKYYTDDEMRDKIDAEVLVFGDDDSVTEEIIFKDETPEQ